MDINPELVARFAPTGRLRAAINLGNPILAQRDVRSGEPGGVSVDLARELARQLGVALELVVFDAAGKSVEAVTQDRADIGFFAVDPLRAAGIAFTAPYVLIEGCYLVPEGSPIRGNDEVDRAGHVVVVGQGSAYDLYLTRELKHATILRSPTSPTVVPTFVEQRADVAAGVKQQLQADALRLGGLRLLDGRFMVIEQAMGVPKSRGDGAAAYLAHFVEQMKASGFVAAALARHGIQGASVAPTKGLSDKEVVMGAETSTQLGEWIVEQMTDAVVYSDRNGTIERWNSGAVATFGYAAGEALGQNLDLIVPEHLRAAHWRGFEAAMASGKMRLEGRPTLTRGLHKSGKKLYVEMSFSLVRDAAGQLLGSVAVARDVTERVEREKAARDART